MGRKKSITPRKKRRRYKYTHNGKVCSKGEKSIALFLDKYGITYIQEKTFKTCLSPKGNSLRFDFFLPHRDILIEYQGHHHYNPINRYRRAQLSHKRTVINDMIKKRFVENSKYVLIEISYWDYDFIWSILFVYLLNVYT